MKQYTAILLSLIIISAAHANDDVIQISNDRVIALFPHSQLYPENIADPHRPVFMLSAMSFNKTTIPGAGQKRLGVKMGARIGLLRAHRKNNPEQGFQLTFGVGFSGQFDSEHSEDNIGWDGIFNFIGQYRFNQEWAVKLGVHHTSSHLGDEFIERTGIQRVDNTRQELLMGANRAFGHNWQVYAETGYGYDLRNEAVQEPWRFQTGVQYQSNTDLWREKLGWYAALDLGAFEESNYSIDTTFQAGLVFYSGLRRIRAGLELYDGRSQITELSRYEEQYAALGLWVDF